MAELEYPEEAAAGGLLHRCGISRLATLDRRMPVHDAIVRHIELAGLLIAEDLPVGYRVGSGKVGALNRLHPGVD
jgi:hypothetical protein